MVKLTTCIHREWMPWRCMEVRFWVSIPNYQSMLSRIYTNALAKSVQECSSDEVHSRHLQVSVFLGQAGLYTESESLLNAALGREGDEGRQADLLHALADVLWKAQQARQGGGKDFLEKVVNAARKSISLRRRMSVNPVQQHKLALTLMIYAENSACYGHYVQAMVFCDDILLCLLFVLVIIFVLVSMDHHYKATPIYRSTTRNQSDAVYQHRSTITHFCLLTYLCPQTRSHALPQTSQLGKRSIQCKPFVLLNLPLYSLPSSFFFPRRCFRRQVWIGPSVERR